MSRSKKLLVLLGIFIVICAVTFAVTKYEVHKENIKNSDAVVLELDPDSVTALSWENETASLSFHKDGSWQYDEDEAFPADEEKIEELLSIFKEFKVSFIIEDVEDYSQYGLNDPVCTIQITADGQADGTGESDTWKITLGAYSKMDSERYVSIGDGNVYLVKDDPLDQYDAGLSDMIRHDEIPVLDEANSITFAGDIAYQISRKEESKSSYQAEDVYFTGDGNNELPLDTSLVNSYLSTVSGLYLRDYATYYAADEDLASYGLDSPELSVTVDYTQEGGDQEDLTNTVTLHISRDPAEKDAAEEETDTDTDTEEEAVTAYARVDDSRIIYKLDGDDYQMLKKAAYNDLRHQNIYYGDFDDVTQIDISLDGGEYSITSEKDGDERTYYYGEEEQDLTKLQSAVESLAADEFTEAEADGKEEIRLTLYLENEEFPQLEITLYRHDGETCLARVNGVSVAYISRADAVDLIEAVNAIIL